MEHTKAEVERITRVYQRYAAMGLGSGKWSTANPGNLAIIRERECALRGLLQQSGFFPFKAEQILDLGCGDGSLLGLFNSWGAQPQNLHGVDLLPERVELARNSYPSMSFHKGNAEALPFKDSQFDLVTVFTLFSSILDDTMATNASREIARVTRSGGAVIWYDLRVGNPSNPNIRGVRRHRIRQLFPGFDCTLRSITLLPPLARRLGSIALDLYPLFSLCAILRTHYLGVLIKM